MQETQVRSLGQEDPLEKGMATHSSILAWRIPGTEELCGLQSLGSQSLAAKSLKTIFKLFLIKDLEHKMLSLINTVFDLPEADWFWMKSYPYFLLNFSSLQIFLQSLRLDT